MTLIEHNHLHDVPNLFTEMRKCVCDVHEWWWCEDWTGVWRISILIWEMHQCLFLFF